MASDAVFTSTLQSKSTSRGKDTENKNVHKYNPYWQNFVSSVLKYADVNLRFNWCEYPWLYQCLAYESQRVNSMMVIGLLLNVNRGASQAHNATAARWNVKGEQKIFWVSVDTLFCLTQ